MREIKFRGVDFNNVWRHGNLIKHIYEDGKLCAAINFIENDVFVNQYDVYPESVGQYIGLKDKNGKEIYEGDIVRFQPNKTIPEELKMMFKGVGEVVSLMGNCFFYMIKIRKDQNVSFRSVFELEVIGNIYENTELLEADKND